MSYYVKPTFCPNYEDNQHYGYVSCMLKTWPDMWPEEMAAEAGVRRERQERKRQAFFLSRDKTYKTLQHFKSKICPIYRMKELAELALADLADECGWEVKNPDRVKYDKVSPIFRTS